MEVIPNNGLGPLRFGMSPEQVRSLLEEPETYEEWMGGNLNNSLLYKGLIIGFDACDAYGPLAHSKFCEASIHYRDDVVIMGKRLLDWSRSAVIDRLEEESLSYTLSPDTDIRVAELSLAFSFGDEDQLIFLEMWVPGKRDA